MESTIGTQEERSSVAKPSIWWKCVGLSKIICIASIRCLLEVIHFQRALRDSKFPECPLVFFNKEGQRIGIFRKSWATACKAMGLEGRLFHEFRRTAIRNMIRARVSVRVAMMISGHRTRNIFERYNIVNEEDLEKSSRRVKEYHQEIILPQNVHNLAQYGHRHS